MRYLKIHYPNAALVWSRDTTLPYIICGLHRWGYVFWDDQRIEDCGVMDWNPRDLSNLGLSRMGKRLEARAIRYAQPLIVRG